MGLNLLPKKKVTTGMRIPGLLQPQDAEELPCNGFTKRSIAGG